MIKHPLLSPMALGEGMKKNQQLTLITQKNNTPTSDYLLHIEKCLKAGVSAVQLREKKLSYDNLLSFGYALKQQLIKYHIPLIVNDNLELALQLDADGLHLGQNDGDVIEARKQLGDNKILGLSIDNLDQVLASNSLPIDYIGIGAIFNTVNKKNIKTIWGVDGLKTSIKLAKHPVVAIGGVNLSNIHAVVKCGVAGVAAIGAFHDTQNPFYITKQMLSFIKEYSHEK